MSKQWMIVVGIWAAAFLGGAALLTAFVLKRPKPEDPPIETQVPAIARSEPLPAPKKPAPKPSSIAPPVAAAEFKPAPEVKWVDVLKTAIMKVGEAGPLPKQDGDFYYKVQRVVSEKQIVVTPFEAFAYESLKVGKGTSASYVPRRVPANVTGKPFVVEMPSANLADGQQIPLPGNYHVAGTHRDGASTYLLLRPIDKAAN